ncbi:disabled homolog 2-like isoform X1 [Morone saxatilis]|uniref:disabled homolog 2-like isoform X1 n=2 Tax=Morone saxatilis TaxID=34816 RepID=UPI0015E1C33F|nr:disabled homolog 2-like isoform X1 [Morone saxatilis]XP_035508730.1 disabled homolog 2-like isoform X1 [Morone saxatilis]XP_035508731.1 disabled homolog 2-like isoform X1 [Morone saxatilis]
MMETEQTAGSSPAPSQTAVRTWLSSSTRGAPRTPTDATSRFLGDGVRYKAKLIGVDPVPDAQGEKMCWDSMMKLKGFEVAARKQGRHKLRVWLKVSSTGLRIVDERTGEVLYDHDRSRISSLTKDESDPRALAYVYQHQDTFSLFYIKMANLADPVLVDIKEVCQAVDQETPQEPVEAQTSSLLLLNDSLAPPVEGPDLEEVFSPRPDSSSGQLNQASSSNELMEVFAIQMEDPMMPSQTSCTSQPESPQPALSSSQILSLFPTQPVGGSPYSSPPYSPTAMPWAQQGLLGNQWAGSAAAPWPTVPGSMAAWPAGVAAPPVGGHIQAHSTQPGVMMGGSTPTSPTTVDPLNSIYAPAGATGPLQFD